MSNMKKEFYAKLYGKDGINESRKYLDTIEACKKNDYELSVYFDLVGELYAVQYSSAGNKADLENAIINYDKSISIKSSNTEFAMWHKANILVRTRRYTEATEIVNKLIASGSDKNKEYYLGTALEISVLTGQWDKSYTLVNALYNMNNNYYIQQIHTLMPSVVALCHFDNPDMAKVFIDKASAHRPEFRENENIKAVSRYYAERCSRK